MIRRLGAGDVTDYRRIRLEGLLHDPAAFMMTYGDWSKRPVADFAARLGQVAMFGAIDGGRIIGTIGLEADHDPTQTGVGWVVEVYVTRNHRGRGVSDQLLAHVVAQSSFRELHLEVAAANAPARALYTRQGFIEIERAAEEQAAKDGSVCEVLMLRRLDP